AARAQPHDFLALTKPRIVGLLVATGLGSAVVAAGGWPGLGPVVAVALGGALAAGGAGAMNAALEADLDARMARTRGRPVPAGRISPAAALAFGLVLEVAAFALITALTNVLAAALALGGAFWYAAVYTLWLKRRTSWNIVVGGAAGSFPPLVGWAAVTGTLHLTAWALAAAIFLWTPPHFWALATLLREDYRRAGIPMLPAVTDLRTVATRMLRYAFLTLVASLAPLAWGGLGAVHGVVAAAAGLWFVGESLFHHRRLSRRTAGRVFWASGIYLLLLFVGAALDRLL
ncbi:MAG TPA: heme o synthase, partial [Actinomycetota bacterium]|nr:heme o synthase [Actinomycetota bacterium]